MNKEQLDKVKQALEVVRWIADQKTGGMIQRKATEAVSKLMEIDNQQSSQWSPKDHYNDGWNDAMRSVAQQPAVSDEPAFHGFMDKAQCCVNICYTPWAPGSRNNVLPTAYYTRPQPAAWVDLTDEDWKEIYLTTDAHTYGRAIEAKLREKNGGNT